MHLGPLGTALLPYEQPRVLLIDELDKSDIDLPNDLLNVFEEGEFEIPELSRLAARHPEVTVLTDDRDGSAVVRRGRVRCRSFPLVIITSNGEREFPAPFLRRCLKLHVDPPTFAQLGAMVAAQFGETDGVDISRLITDFMERSEATGGLASDQLLNAVHMAMQLATSGAYQPDDDWQELLTAMPCTPRRRPQRSDDAAVRVAHVVGEHLPGRKPIVRNFRDALSDPHNTPDPDPTSEARPYLRVQEAVFCALSGRYATEARRMRLKLGRSGVMPGTGTALTGVATIPGPAPESLEPQEPALTYADTGPLSEGGQMTASDVSHSKGSGRALERRPQMWGAVQLRSLDFRGTRYCSDYAVPRVATGEATALLPEALHGMGGMGKSQIVVEYIYRHATEYAIVWWIAPEHTTHIRPPYMSSGSLRSPLAHTAQLPYERQIPANVNLHSRRHNVSHLPALIDRNPQSRTSRKLAPEILTGQSTGSRCVAQWSTIPRVRRGEPMAAPQK